MNQILWAELKRQAYFSRKSELRRKVKAMTIMAAQDARRKRELEAAAREVD